MNLLVDIERPQAMLVNLVTVFIDHIAAKSALRIGCA